MRKITLTLVFLASTLLADEHARRGPYLQDLRTDRVTVLWTTNDPADGEVAFGEGADLSRTVKEPTAGKHHRLVLEGLEAGKTYSYRISSDGEEGEVHSFGTMVPPGTPFTFVAYGDTRSDGDVHRRIAAAIRKEHPLFLIHTGDIVADGSVGKLWNEFFQEGGALLAESPIFPALGNHEHDAGEYFDTFELPGKERWYSFDCGDAHFVALDSNKVDLASRKQREFLSRDLEDHATSPWEIVYFHHPPFATTDSTLRELESMLVQATFVPPIEKNGVSLVFNGHDHNYQHSLVNGVHYVLTAGGGADLYDLGDAKKWTVARAKAHHFVRVEVSKEKVTVTAIDLDGKVIETFDLAPDR